MFHNVFAGKKVFITGHTGFKGSWLSIWLLKLGAKVVGFSDRIPTNPSMFEETSIQSRVQDIVGDVRDYESIRSAILATEPDFVFHLAAQAIVSESYKNPLETVSVNVVGTMNLLEALRQVNHKCVAVLITSDKCYENVEWVWGYKETDHLGGRDIYSGSKGAAEVVIHSFIHTFFNRENSNVVIATGRAGNVIGGGDWAKDRIVADCMRSWSIGNSVEIRSPNATRPWQHVLEPLSGYLCLAAALVSNPKLSGESFNFGPRSERNQTVLDLLNSLALVWGFENFSDAYRVVDNVPFHEAGLLKLNCDKALFHLGWEANLSYHECVKYVAEWYFAFYKKQTDMYANTLRQIEEYEALAKKRALPWAC